jgi:Protein of unknown function (DUF3619)
MSASKFDHEGDETFVRQLKDVLDAGNAHLDARVRSRLTQARHAALAQIRSRRAAWMPSWAPAAGVAAAVALAVVVWPRTRPAPAPEDAYDDLEIVLAGENLDLLEDLDFYEWVDASSESNI